jgi:cytochrome c oxidase subunit 1
MPRRYYSYLDQFQPLHVFSTVGSWVLGLGFLIMAVYLWASLRRPMDAPANPWGATGLEWQTPSPPPEHNFENAPSVTRGPYDYSSPEPTSAEVEA